MRSPHFIAVAVRKPNHKIVIKNVPYQRIAPAYSFFEKTDFSRRRGMLVESMVQGIDALSYSANIASDRRGCCGQGELSSWAIFASIASAFLLGMGLFVALPAFSSQRSSRLVRASELDGPEPLFHLFDGVLKMMLLLSYVYLIAMMRDIHRVFQYHGAEHKSIYTFEAGEELTVENARKYTTLHPRCGTSFLLFLVVISILVFSIIFPLFI